MAEIYYYCEADNATTVTSTALECTSELFTVTLPQLATDQLTTQLAAIGDFDTARIATLIAIYLVFFVTGVSVGIVMRQMRRA